MSFVIAHIIRLISSLFGILADRANDIKRVYLYNAIYSFLTGVQYFLLGAITGAICSMLAIFRNYLFCNYYFI